MFDFVDYFIGKSIVLHANTKDMKMDLLVAAKEVNKQGKYAMVSSYNQENCSMFLENVDVHGIMLSSQASINYIMSCFKHRKRENKEPWILYIQVELVNQTGWIQLEIYLLQCCLLTCDQSCQKKLDIFTPKNHDKSKL